PPLSRNTPTRCQLIDRTSVSAIGSGAIDCDPGAGRSNAADGVGQDEALHDCMARPARRPNNSPSSNELLASRLAPCTPVQATSPAANKPGSDVRPSRSVSTPPMK